jgi:hypothetical protein
VAALVQQLESSAHVAARQMAAVLLRPKMKKLWKKLDAATQTEVKAKLLQRIVNEEQRSVRVSAAALVATVAKQELPAGKWDDLLTFLLDCSKSATAGHREVAMLLFRALSEHARVCIYLQVGPEQHAFSQCIFVFVFVSHVRITSSFSYSYSV